MDIESVVQKLDKVCRICLKECYNESKCRSLFSELSNEEILDDNIFFLYEILTDVTSMQVRILLEMVSDL